ncbi:MAG: oxygenase MpaB family protein [Gordonia sp. (in: high G+C Gram-positive bacteria)]
MSTRSHLHRIAALDPDRDHQEIHRITAMFEFPWDYVRALEFALFRTYCVPTISALLARTGEFRDRPQKRYDDTAMLMAELIEHGYDAPRGKASLRRINQMHNRYDISNDDMMYVLTTFIYDPLDWIDAYGYRPLHPHERIAAFQFYREVGRRMGIRDIPDDSGPLLAFKKDYERRTFGYSETNAEIGRYTVDLLASWYPIPRAMVAIGVEALIDAQMTRAFGFRPPRPGVGPLLRTALRVRGRIVAHLPERTTSAFDTTDVRSYPQYAGRRREIEPSSLGTFAG